MSVFDLLRRFFEPPGMRDPFFGGMTQGEEEEEDDDEDDLFHGPPGGGVQSRLWHGRPPFQDPFGFEDIFRDFNELFADFGSVIGDVPRIAGMEPPGMSPGGCRGRSLRDSMLKYPDSPLPTEPGPTSQDPPTEGPPHADGAIRDRKGWLEDDGGDLPTGSSKQDRVLDSEISSHGLDSVLRSRDPAPSFSFRSVSVSKVLRPDGTVEEKRTVRDSRGNTTTTVTVTRGDEVISTGSIDGPRDSDLQDSAPSHLPSSDSAPSHPPFLPDLSDSQTILSRILHRWFSSR